MMPAPLPTATDPNPTLPIETLLQQLACSEGQVAVLVVDESQERLLDLRFQPASEVAALLRLHRFPPDHSLDSPIEKEPHA